MKLLMILLCRGTCVPVDPPFQRAGGAVPPSCTPVPASLRTSEQYLVLELGCNLNQEWGGVGTHGNVVPTHLFSTIPLFRLSKSTLFV